MFSSLNTENNKSNEKKLTINIFQDNFRFHKSKYVSSGYRIKKLKYFVLFSMRKSHN